jgi:hypothetical protein
LAPHDGSQDSPFIVSLRDAIERIKRLVWGANIAVGTIVATPPPIDDMPAATPYPTD